jgi:outer membrane protein assembly factor BamB
MMQKRTYVIILLLLGLTLGISACAGGTVGATNWPGVTANGEVVYLAYNTQVYAVNAASGVEKWRYPAEKPEAKKTFFAAPVLTPDGQLLAPSYNHKLYSLDPQTGAEKWVFDDAKDLYVASPLVTEKGIYAPNADGKLYGLDFQGNKFAEFEAENHLWGTPATNSECDCIFLPSMDRHLYALDAADLSLIWKSDDFGGAIISQPVFGEDGTVYLGTFGSELLAVDGSNGNVKWRFAAKGAVFASPVLEGDVIYFGDMKGNLFAVNTADGKEIWNKVIGGAVVSNPMIKDGVIYVSAESENIYAFKLDGTPEWTQTLKFLVYGPIIESGDLLLVGPNNPAEPLVALTTSGAQSWTFSLQK